MEMVEEWLGVEQVFPGFWAYCNVIHTNGTGSMR
jgi:hypothetical protein